MPPFASLSGPSIKRKNEEHDSSSRKRPSLDSGGPSNAAFGVAGSEQYWMAQWRHPQYRKHKTWDGDAILVVKGTKVTMWDLDDKFIGSGTFDGEPIAAGTELKVGGKELEIDCAVSRADYLSGACFGRAAAGSTQSESVQSAAPVRKQFAPLQPKNSSSFKPPVVSKGIPLQPVDLLSTVPTLPSRNDKVTSEKKSHWSAQWRKPQQKKNKTWEGDAFVSLEGDKLCLISESGKLLGRTTWNGLPLYSGFTTRIGGKEVELDSSVPASQVPAIVGTSQDAENDVDMLVDLVASPRSSIAVKQADTSFLMQPNELSLAGSGANPTKFVAPTSFYASAPPKTKAKGPLHDPAVEGAIILKAPTKDHMKRFNKKNLEIVPVVVDPIVARHLRPHQIDGVKFLYECVMGLRKHEGQGCILADEMGLGKTLQTISLIWTLLKQNPYVGAGAVIGKCLIVCPVTLVNNWKAEFHKWLGRDRVGVLTGDKDKTVVKQFVNSKVHQVLIIGYERLRTVIDDLAYCQPPIGLIVCDEGHRLKSANNKTSQMFKALRTSRRVILSGTPIQNDLSEFHAMADFCNPGLLDEYNVFRRVYETPILKSRTPDSTPKEAEIGQARSAQLLTISRSFVLRREATILKNYLPPKHEYVVFITPTALQLSMFSTILNQEKMDNILHSSTAESLALIGILTKISNSPILLKAQADAAKAKGGEAIQRAGVQEALALLPHKAEIFDFSLSGKLSALARLLKVIRQHTEEKIIIVSHYTSTLNVIEQYCKKKTYSYHRLDGQTPANKRQEYVNDFNKSSQYTRFIFLLSSKAGGVGLNLIGASRLVLIDSDWNPSHDLQAMARIHRDGQKRPVYIYRFLTAGTIDEKIYQRQVTKLGLSDSLMGSGDTSSKGDSFSRKDLRDIFRVHPDTSCNTHDLIECPCINASGSDLSIAEKATSDSDTDSIGESSDEEEEGTVKGFVAASQVKTEDIMRMDKAYLKKKKAQLAALSEWNHIDCLHTGARDNVPDDILRKLLYSKPEPSKTVKAPPKSRVEALLAAVDMDNVSAFEDDEGRLSVGDVPGGTISFLFEKSSVTKLDATVQDSVDSDSET